MPLKSPRPTLDDLARMCLDHMVANPELLGEFMVQSGLDPQSLRRMVGTSAFGRGLVEYVVHNEPLLLAISAANNLRPETMMDVWARQQAPRE